MTAILIDIGRHVIRFGVMNDDDVILRQFSVFTPSGQAPESSFHGFVKRVLCDHEVEIAQDTTFVIGAPGPFRGGKFSPMLMDLESWEVNIEALRQELSPDTHVIHDVMAGALSIGALRPDDIIYTEVIAPPKTESGEGNMPYRSTLYIQTGIGLGAAALIPDATGERIPFSTEAGSSTIAPCPRLSSKADSTQANPDRDERCAYDFLAASADNEWGYLTAQYLLSAHTLAKIYQALAPAGKIPQPQEIVAQAKSNDPFSERALGVFAAFLGTFAGDLAMSFRAYDGVYIGGPIASRLTPAAIERFHHRFSERGERNHQLKGVPVALVTNEFNALLGLREALPSVRGTIQ